MVKEILEVLTGEEVNKIKNFYEEVSGLESISIIEKPLHIECFEKKGKIAIGTSLSLINIYANKFQNRPIKQNNALIEKLKTSEEDLIEKRENYSNLERNEILKEELKERTRQLIIHKYYLSEKMGFDVGMGLTAAHWLKAHSAPFYSFCKIQYDKLGVKFEWIGTEKAVILAWEKKDKSADYRTLVKNKDYFVEELLAQQGKFSQEGNPTKTFKLARQRLNQLRKEKQLILL